MVLPDNGILSGKCRAIRPDRPRRAGSRCTHESWYYRASGTAMEPIMSEPTIADGLEPFLASLGRTTIRANTLRAYRADLRIAAIALPAPLAHITAAQIDAFLSAPAVACATLARRRATLQRFFRWARREGFVVTNPCADVDPIRLPRRLPRPIESDADRRAVDALIAASPQPYRLIFTLLRETGMRAGEVLALNVGDITLDLGREGLRVRAPKNGVERIVILGPDATPRALRGLRVYLKSLGSVPPHTPLWISDRGSRLSYAALHYQWTQRIIAAGLTVVRDGATLPRYTLHQLRHTHGTELIEQGQSLAIVQRRLGHADIRQTQGYADFSETQQRAALAKRR